MPLQRLHLSLKHGFWIQVFLNLCSNSFALKVLSFLHLRSHQHATRKVTLRLCLRLSLMKPFILESSQDVKDRLWVVCNMLGSNDSQTLRALGHSRRMCSVASGTPGHISQLLSDVNPHLRLFSLVISQSCLASHRNVWMRLRTFSFQMFPQVWGLFLLVEVVNISKADLTENCPELPSPQLMTSSWSSSSDIIITARRSCTSGGRYSSNCGHFQPVVAS